MNTQKADDRLVRLFAYDGSERAFGELVSRHINFVYSVCRRCLGDSELASDVTQVVFLLFAQKARSLPSGTILSGWLFRTAHYACQNALKAERRRKHNEGKAAMEMMQSQGDDEEEWKRFEPGLDDAIARLSESDRAILLLRYADGLSMEEAAHWLGITGSAAQRRVSRAVERLRAIMARSGVTVSATLLAVMLSKHTVEAAPPALTAAIISGDGSSYAQGAQGLSGEAHSLYKGLTHKMLVAKIAMSTVVACGIFGAVGLGHLNWHGSVHVGPALVKSDATPVPTSVMTSSELVADCLHAYSQVKTFQQSVTDDGAAATADIKFEARGKMRIDGKTLFYSASLPSVYGFVTDGNSNWMLANGTWTAANNADTAFGTLAGVSGRCVNVVPPLLLKSAGTLSADPGVSEETVGGKPAYRISQVVSGRTFTTWIDEKSFFVVKSSMTMPNFSFVEDYGTPVVDQQISQAIFTRPAGAP